MFIDEISIKAIAGKGGNGAASFRREKFVPLGGPDGGDGGRGGSIVVKADKRLNSLGDFRRKRIFRAAAGGNGHGGQKHGSKGRDITLKVPAGTLVWRGDELAADLASDGAKVMVARGGRGGLGNVHFKTSTRQAPRFAQRGEPGEEVSLRLELKLISDVGIVGLPNVGKSTLLAAATRARPKIANYPFTTLSPNLGVAETDDLRLVMADIPGLIEGAHHGVGLGYLFLRHIERTLVLLHVVDGSAADPAADFAMLNAELTAYSAAVATKPQIVVCSKMDVPEAASRWEDTRSALAALGVSALPVSGVTGEGVEAMIAAIGTKLKEVRESLPKEVPVSEPTVLRPLRASERIAVIRDGQAFIVAGRLLERAVAMSDADSPEAMALLRKTFRRLGADDELAAAGAKAGDRLLIGDEELEWWGLDSEAQK